jgi:hypothetical protein
MSDCEKSLEEFDNLSLKNIAKKPEEPNHTNLKPLLCFFAIGLIV